MNYKMAKVRELDKNEELVNFKLLIAVPGATKDDVKVEYTDDKLFVSIEDHPPKNNGDTNIVVESNEISFDAASWEFDASGLNISKTKVNVENGIIYITIPVSQKPKRTSIKIG